MPPTCPVRMQERQEACHRPLETLQYSWCLLALHRHVLSRSSSDDAQLSSICRDARVVFVPECSHSHPSTDRCSDKVSVRCTICPSAADHLCSPALVRSGL